MSNVLSDEKREQVLALGRLGWSLRRIEEATGGSPGDGEPIPENRRGRRAPPWGQTWGLAAKTGHHSRGAPRPWTGESSREGGVTPGLPAKTGHHDRGAPRLWVKTGHFRGDVHRPRNVETGQSGGVYRV